jgi:hypothetical protein
MKMTSHTVMLLPLLALTAGMSIAADPVPATWTDRMTDDQLRELQQRPSTLVGKVTEVQAPREQKSFAETSDFINFNGVSTFVPKGAILHIPGQYRELVTASPGSKLLMWRDFLRQYPAIVGPLEVGLAEASGAKPIEPRLLESAVRSGRIIVAVIRGNPSSISSPLSVQEKETP